MTARRDKPRPSVRLRGFSLLELLLVLVIVGFIVTLAGISVSSGSRDYQVEGSVLTFANVAEYAMDEAQLANRDFGLLLRQRETGREVRFSYQWLQRLDGGWVEARTDAEIFSPREFPPGLELELEVEESDTEPASELGEDEAEEQLLPQVVFYASGETTPGILTLVEVSSGEVAWRLEWDLLGRMKLLRAGLADDEAI